VNRAAHFISLSSGYLKLISDAEIYVGTVFSASRRAVVARGYDNVVLDDNSAEVAAHTGGSLGNRFGYIKIIIVL
jgi:hypothetical protein